MSFVTTQPEALAAAAGTLQGIGAALSSQNAAAAAERNARAASACATASDTACSPDHRRPGEAMKIYGTNNQNPKGRDGRRVVEREIRWRL